MLKINLDYITLADLSPPWYERTIKSAKEHECNPLNVKG